MGELSEMERLIERYGWMRQYSAAVGARDALLTAVRELAGERDALAVRVVVLEAEVARLREALGHYGDHDAGCESNGDDRGQPNVIVIRTPRPCDCGFLVALGASAATVAEMGSAP